MKKDIKVSAAAIDGALWQLRFNCERLDAAGDGNGRAIWVYYAVSRYVGTGRASLEWLRGFLVLSDERMMALCKRAGADPGSDDEILRVVNRFVGG